MTIYSEFQWAPKTKPKNPKEMNGNRTLSYNTIN